MHNFAHYTSNVHAHDARGWLLLLVLLAIAVTAMIVITVKYTSTQRKNKRETLKDN